MPQHNNHTHVRLLGAEARRHERLDVPGLREVVLVGEFADAIKRRLEVHRHLHLLDEVSPLFIFGLVGGRSHLAVSILRRGDACGEGKNFNALYRCFDDEDHHQKKRCKHCTSVKTSANELNEAHLSRAEWKMGQKLRARGSRTTSTHRHRCRMSRQTSFDAANLYDFSIGLWKYYTFLAFVFDHVFRVPCQSFRSSWPPLFAGASAVWARYPATSPRVRIATHVLRPSQPQLKVQQRPGNLVHRPFL